MINLILKCDKCYHNTHSGKSAWDIVVAHSGEVRQTNGGTKLNVPDM